MPNITVIAHNIRSTYNIGSIFRTCEGFGAHKLILSGYTPYPKSEHDTRLPHIANKLHAQIHKTALDAELIVPFEYYETLDGWLCENDASPSPMPVYALEQAPGSTSIQSFTPAQSFALLLGEEVNGIEPHYLSRSDEIIEIPMSGNKESFNVSVACGIALYALSFHGHTLPANHSRQPIE